MLVPVPVLQALDIAMETMESRTGHSVAAHMVGSLLSISISYFYAMHFIKLACIPPTRQRWAAPWHNSQALALHNLIDCSGTQTLTHQNVLGISLPLQQRAGTRTVFRFVHNRLGPHAQPHSPECGGHLLAFAAVGVGARHVVFQGLLAAPVCCTHN